MSDEKRDLNWPEAATILGLLAFVAFVIVVLCWAVTR